jgi:uncharacterized protein
MDLSAQLDVLLGAAAPARAPRKSKAPRVRKSEMAGATPAPARAKPRRVSPRATPRIDAPTQPMTAERVDSWVSALTGLGTTSHDKRMSTGFIADIVSDREARDLWRGDDLAKRVIELIPKAMMRSGFDIKIENSKEEAEGFSALFETLKATAIFQKAKMYERAYGGAAIWPVINDGAIDMSLPLNEDRISEVSHLTLFEPRELQPFRYYSDPKQPKYGEVEVWRVVPIIQRGMVTIDTFIHETRLIVFPGIRVSKEEIAQYPGWGDSVLTYTYRVLCDFNVSWSSAAILLNDFAQPVFKMKGLSEALATDVDEIIRARMQAVEMSRSTARTVMIDADAEDFERKQTPVTGMPELLDRFALRLSAATGIPVTLLMGQSPAGMNATGASDITFFYDMIDGERSGGGMLDQLSRLLYLLIRSKTGPTRGVEPEKWSIEFRSLYSESTLEKTQARKTQAETDVLYITNGVLAPEEVALSRFGGDTYSIETVVDFNNRTAMEEFEAKQEEQALAEAEAKKPEPPPDGEPDPFGGDDDDDDRVDVFDLESLEAQVARVLFDDVAA